MVQGAVIMQCSNCGNGMHPGLANWHFVCSGCGLEASTLEPTDLATSDAVVDEADREVGLETLRKASFAITFDILRKQIAPGRLLDVGCAHGWFLDAGRDAGFQCTGVEPSVQVAARGISRGHDVLTGYFPAVVADRQPFDVISFNDVFEHIPDADRTMKEVSGLLAPGGILSIAIPSNSGFFYRLSRILARAGMPGPFERMWQKQFSSPHLYYFKADVLVAMASRHGLQVLHRSHLPSVRREGLWGRLGYDTTSGPVRNALTYAAVVTALPFLRLLPADIDLLMFKKPEGLT
jgi:2-polyprenyl-3-methyl-5-hydroxy-6-metoxy-1,4-benzoquinol methylase